MWRNIFWLAIIVVSLRSYAGGADMLDRAIGIVGLALASFGLIAQYRWEKVPRWVTDVGLAIDCVLVRLAIAPLVGLPGTGAVSAGGTAAKPDIHFKLWGGGVFEQTGLPGSLWALG